MRRQRSPLKGLVACAALLLVVAQSAASSPSADAPPNTERTTPSSPPSDAVIERLAAAAAGLPKMAPVSRMELSDTVQQAYFASGSDELTPPAAARLDEFVSSLHGAQVQRVLVEAHTDAQRLVHEAKRRFVTNQRLSEARAARVAQYLQKVLALPEERSPFKVSVRIERLRTTTATRGDRATGVRWCWFGWQRPQCPRRRMLAHFRAWRPRRAALEMRRIRPRP